MARKVWPGRSQGATTRLSLRHDTAGLHAGQAAARAQGLARLSRDTNCIVAGGRPCRSRYSARLGRLVVSRDKRETA